MKQKLPINECIIVSKEIQDKFILAKNRDRKYKPELEVIHELIDGVEVCYLHDKLTDWSEGINEYGIGIVNTALLVGYDEKELEIIKKTGRISDDGKKMRRALSQKTIKDALISIVKYLGGLRGHTFISSDQHMVTVETTMDTPRFKLANTKNPIVRTNHGHVYSNAGYKKGKPYESSRIRQLSAELQAEKTTDWRNLLKNMRARFFEKDSPFNMRRVTDKLSTSSQLLLNLTDRIFWMTYIPSQVKSFKGVVNRLPKGYAPKIKIKIEKIEEESK